MKKVKGVGSTTSAASLLPELEKLNVSKFLDEIATHVCEAKIKLAEVPSLVEFCVQLTSMYEGFASVLLNELKKHIPTKRSDVVANPSKLRVDIKYDCSVPSRVYSLMVKVNWMLRLVADLCLHGVLGEGGIKLIGSALAYLVLLLLANPLPF
jgi:regulator of nonsense transcripts 2